MALGIQASDAVEFALQVAGRRIGQFQLIVTDETAAGEQAETEYPSSAQRSAIFVRIELEFTPHGRHPSLS